MPILKKSRSEQALSKKGYISALQNQEISPIVAQLPQGIPQISTSMVKDVSNYRREIMANEVKRGIFSDGSASLDENTSNSAVISSVGTTKYAQVVGGNSGNYHGMAGDVIKQTPEVYSPLWLNSNLNLPRDRATINAWCRSFYALNPFVHNAIGLHSTYPISKLNIKCSDKKIERFFNDMIEEIDLMNICVQIAQEYWLLGEAFVYAELDESVGKWSRLLIQNPDYMLVRRTVVASEPIIMLRPDENLKKIVMSNRSADIEQRKQLNQYIIDNVRKGNNIPLDNFHVSHIARRISPYEIRGTGLPVCVFRPLMLYDRLKECYSSDTEVLTDKGFKKITDLICRTTDLNINQNYVNGVELDENNLISSIITMKEDFKVACFNQDSNVIEYHKPTELHMSKYSGEMINFISRNYDILVSPNHKMWVQKKNRINNINGWSDWHKENAKDINPNTTYRFRGKIDWIGNNLTSVKILDKEIPIELYLKFLGYVISEGYINTYYIDMCQKIDSDCINDLKDTVFAFTNIFDQKVYQRIIKTEDYKKYNFKKQPSDRWNCRIYNKDLVNHFKCELSTYNNTKSLYKKIPDWVKNLNKDLLNILLESLVLGDGSHINNKCSKAFRYYTISKQLADDVQEITLKCGYSSSIITRKENPKRKNIEYIVSWSNAKDGQFPVIYPDSRRNIPKINKIDYDGIVWCFEVPTGLFITRRNGKVTVQGNSKYVQADSMINPMTLVKIGSADYKPTPADLEVWRNVFECYDEETEILTEQGFKHFNDVIEYIDNDEQKINCQPKSGIKIACFNSDNEQLEYHEPLETKLYNYNGDMYHFSNNKMDIKVTPEHDMWISEKKYEYNGHRSVRKTYWGEWKKVKAKNINLKEYSRVRSKINWIGDDNINSINVCNYSVPIELYLEYLGYLLSEGCLYTDNKYHYMVGIYQTISKFYKQMKECVDKFSLIINKNSCQRIEKRSEYSKCTDIWSARFHGKDLFNHFRNEVQNKNGEMKCYHKQMPRWIMKLSPRLLKILLKALVDGDGSVCTKNKVISYMYYTTSKQLADDVYEIVYKCGYVPLLAIKNPNKDRALIYAISWSESERGNFPLIFKTNTDPRTKEKHNIVNIEKYNGKVWCFTVPTGLFITRRNGKITIQGNSATADKDFKIFTHDGVTVERIGYGSGIYDISNDITQVIKEIYIGLQVPSVLMDGGADTTYANGGVALDVLRQRYMQFRNMMAIWLKRKIFAPISKIQDFWNYSGGEKQLVVPEIEWNHMSLFDAGDYINNLIALTTGEGETKRASLHTLYRSLGLEYEDEMMKIRKEAIQSAIAKKEKEALEIMSLNALRTLSEEDEIPEIKEPNKTPSVPESPVPGETPGGLPPLPSSSPLTEVPPPPM